jgi:hypothetical protein
MTSQLSNYEVSYTLHHPYVQFRHFCDIRLKQDSFGTTQPKNSRQLIGCFEGNLLGVFRHVYIGTLYDELNGGLNHNEA